ESGSGVTVPHLAAGSSISFTITASVTAIVGSVTNTFSVTPPGTVIDPNSPNNTASDTDTVQPVSDLAVTKTDGVSTVDAGGTTTYTLTLTNNGPSDANDATIKDPAVAGLSKTAVGTCTPAPGAV